MHAVSAVSMPRKGAFQAGFWRLADPKISLASMASLFLGAAASAADGPVAWGWLALTVAGIFAVEVAKNASGEVFDFDSGTDLRVTADERSPFSGGKRVMVDGLLSRAETWAIAAGGYGVAVVAGLVIVFGREPAVIWVAAGGLGLAFFYHAPPLRLSYRGLGELAVAAAYGPGICAGTYLVQRGQVSAEVILLGLPLGLLIGAFLWINEFPDCRADRASGKRTLVVRLGPAAASRGYAVLVAAAFVLAGLLPLWGISRGVWLGLGAAPLALLSVRQALRAPTDIPALIPAQARALMAFVGFAVLAGVGVAMV